MHFCFLKVATTAKQLSSHESTHTQLQQQLYYNTHSISPYITATALSNHEINAEWLGIKYVLPNYFRLAILTAQNPIHLNLCVGCRVKCVQGKLGTHFESGTIATFHLHTHCSFVTVTTKKEQRDHHIWMNTMHHLQWAAACTNPSGRNTKPNAQHPQTSWRPPVSLELTEAGAA